MEGDKIRPNVLIDIVAADVMHNKYILTKFMKERGYVLIQIKHTSLLFGDTLTHFVFASANPRDVTNEIHEKYDYLYHVTSEEHLNNIFSEGKMLPKSRHGDMKKESGIIYSPRIYFLTDIERARKLQFNKVPDSLTAFRIIRLHL